MGGRIKASYQDYLTPILVTFDNVDFPVALQHITPEEVTVSRKAQQEKEHNEEIKHLRSIIKQTLEDRDKAKQQMLAMEKKHNTILGQVEKILIAKESILIAKDEEMKKVKLELEKHTAETEKKSQQISEKSKQISDLETARRTMEEERKTLFDTNNQLMLQN